MRITASITLITKTFIILRVCWHTVGKSIGTVYPSVSLCMSVSPSLSPQDSGSQQIGFLLGSCGVGLALTSEVCLKGLPKTPNGEIMQFKGQQVHAWSSPASHPNQPPPSNTQTTHTQHSLIRIHRDSLERLKKRQYFVSWLVYLPVGVGGWIDEPAVEVLYWWLCGLCLFWYHKGVPRLEMFLFHHLSFVYWNDVSEI